ncbi:cystatin-F isoform X1 [Enhydra lutris kenyoni]|uniref:Cystatin-F isoform X1 n=1 Tax=Enhydra lutris kenyoni TaxID=391180 RepID=A0A2Y9IMW1_ENHLU|nr:cystatin-F isoform X1 [Enhydra lutris kenyoni]
MRPVGVLLAFCCLVLSTTGDHLRDFCSQTLNPDRKPGFPKKINPHDPGVLQAARHSAERFNNCTNDIFLFKESHISRALVQIVKGLKYMLDMKIGRTSCKKIQHPILDNCDFQTNHTLKRVKRRGLTSSHPLTAVPALTRSPGLWETSLLASFQISLPASLQ